MNVLEIVIFLLLCALALGWVSRRAGLPYPIALVLGGGALGFVPKLPPLQFDPQYLLVLVLRRLLTRRPCSLRGATSRPTCARSGCSRSAS
jgi:NhaP-type Na+/H+ or K+/H+ antiporter